MGGLWRRFEWILPLFHKSCFKKLTSCGLIDKNLEMFTGYVPRIYTRVLSREYMVAEGVASMPPAGDRQIPNVQYELANSMYTIVSIHY
jgi:hypothetical protein